MNLYSLNRETLERLTDSFFIGKIPVIKDEIAAEETLVIHNLQDVLREIKPYLTGEDYGAMAYASHLIKLEDKGVDIRGKQRKLFETYGPDGARMYSLLRSGVFEREFSNWSKERLTPDEISTNVKKLIKDPDALFVSFLMQKENVKEEIRKRFSKNITSFPIYARAGRVEAARQAVQELLHERDDVACKIEEYPLGATPTAITIHIHLIR